MQTFRRLTVFTIALLALVFALPIMAQQPPDPIEPPIVEPPIGRPPFGGVFTNPEWMSIDFHRVNITVENQIATTRAEMQFTNNGEGFVEGTFIFPLPDGAAVDDLIMYIDGQPIEARILPAGEAREIYNEIVRQYRDPALLEYVDRNTLQANVFPIPPNESRRIEIGYTQVLEVDNGLIKLTYPMLNTATKDRATDSMSLSVNVDSMDAISTVYSPSHNVAVSREGDNAFRVGFERSNFVHDTDFVLYYGLENEAISVNLLTFKESADEDGFFMLLVQPPVEVPDDQLVAKDVILVIDQSGSMDGAKWQQAQRAAGYVLENLNEADRFNAVVFSTGWRVFSNELEPASVAGEAAAWINTMYAEGGTDINGALTTALQLADAERPTTILFMTDGLATEGVIATPEILDNLEAEAGDNVRIFTFGVGDDVDTVLLDSITRDFRGASSYVRPSESIDEEVASLYNKVAAPVLTDVAVDFGDVRTDTVYPTGQLPDLFAGEQLTIVGRYRNGADGVTVTVSGDVAGEPTTFTYEDFSFRERAGGEPFIARLWATRRIGDLLNTIRLNGESEELVDSVVNLSLRYGIITPYTSFLIEEDDILSQQGRNRAAEAFREDASALSNNVTGASAVDAADALGGMADASAPIVMQMPSPAPTMPAPQAAPSLGIAPAEANKGFVGGEMAETEEELMFEADDMAMDMDSEGGAGAARDEAQAPIVNANDKSFILQAGVYVDTTFEPDTMDTVKLVFLSDDYFDVLAQFPELGEYFAIGDAVIVVYEGIAYEVTPE